MATKKPCKYGVKCFRKNAAHLKSYDHFSEDIEEGNENLETIQSQDKNVECKEISDKLIISEYKSNNNIIEEQETEKMEIENIEKYDLTQIKNIREFVFEVNKMKMPDDFYEFLDFCKSINENDPKYALKLIDLELAGIYDLILFGYKLDYKTHSRFYYDPPEFQTILINKNSDTQLHFGYFRDDPDELPNFVGLNEAKIDCKINCKGDNIFAAVNWFINELISGRNYKTKCSLEDLKSLNKRLEEWCQTHHKNDKSFSLQTKTPRTKCRDKKINCKTFHGAGIVVPVDKNGFGYREVPETYESQKKIFTNYCIKDTDVNSLTKKKKADERIQEIITLIQFANDETDYGMALEFGTNLFCFGDLSLHKFIKTILPICYDLLGRSVYSEILREHLKNRKLNF